MRKSVIPNPIWYILAGTKKSVFSKQSMPTEEHRMHSIKSARERNIDFRNGLRVMALIRKTQAKESKTENKAKAHKLLDTIKDCINDARIK